MFCPKCGNENQDANRFCKKCGRQLPERSGVRQAPASGLIGHVLDGKYRIDSKLGSGGMGDVYQATRLLIGDTVAIKILHGHLARDPAAAERFRREAVTATKLRHRNVVTIFDVGIAAGYNVPYILMERAEGFSLRQFVKGGTRLPLEFAVTVTAQVCAALDEAHRLGIVHRDIKPENIIANQTGNSWQIKILDFGIAKLYDQADIGLTQDGNAMGTPQYMSPEQCMGERVGAASDIYSVGIVLYEMLCGTVPFKGPSALAISNYQVQNAPRPLRELDSSIHPEVEAVVLRSLAKPPHERQQTASQLAKDLINVATIAYRSGQAQVSAEPIPEPAVTPDFVPIVAEADDQSEPKMIVPDVPRGDVTEILPHAQAIIPESAVAETSSIGPDPEETLVIPPDQTIELNDGPSDREQTEPALEIIEDKPKRVRKKKDAPDKPRKAVADELTPPVVEPLAAEPAVADEAATTPPPSEPSMESDNGFVPLRDSEPVSIERAVEPEAPAPAQLDEVVDPIEKPQSEMPHYEKVDERATQKVDLSVVLEGAEAKLDEMLPNEADRSLIERQTEVLPPPAIDIFLPDQVLKESDSVEPAKEESRPERDRHGTESEAPAVAVTEIPESEKLPAGEAPADTVSTNAVSDIFAPVSQSSSRPMIYAGAGVVVVGLVIVVSVAAWYFLIGGPEIIIDGKPSPTPQPSPPSGMAYVQGGEFTMGSSKADKFSRPEHKVTVGPFFMDITEVTNEEYKKFVDATAHRPPPDWKNGTFPDGKARFPVTGVKWDDANEYAKWADKRLPTEAEWEFAARGTDGRLYPWGNKWDRTLANAAGATRGMREVGQGGASPFGMYDMSGNAWEWTASDAAAYPGGKAFPGGPYKIIRGGNWESPPANASSVYRGRYGPTGEPEYNGTSFRCVKDISQGKEP